MGSGPEAGYSVFPRRTHSILFFGGGGRLIYFSVFIYFLFQFLNYFIVQLQLSAFSPHLSTPPQPNSPPSPASNLPLGFVHVSFIGAPENPYPLPSGYC